jgi:DNA-binding transcriptional regulator YdaS (Cro superfamily)
MNLRQFLDGLPRGGISEFATQSGVTPVYLSQLAARQDGREPSPGLCVTIERATAGKVTRQDLRPDDYWLIWPDLPAPKQEEAPANIAPAAIEPIAADAVVVAVLVAPVKPAVTTGAVQPRSGARRTGTPSPYNHSDIDRRDDLPGRREFNGGADKAKGV